MPNTFAEWAAWAGIVVPLCALAWSAWRYVDTKKREIEHADYRRFFEVTEHLGKPEGSVASKVVAAYELRKFTAYREVVIRLCDQVQVEGAAADMLRNELRLTKEHLEKT